MQTERESREEMRTEFEKKVEFTRLDINFQKLDITKKQTLFTIMKMDYITLSDFRKLFASSSTRKRVEKYLLVSDWKKITSSGGRYRQAYILNCPKILAEKDRNIPNLRRAIELFNNLGNMSNISRQHISEDEKKKKANLFTALVLNGIDKMEAQRICIFLRKMFVDNHETTRLNSLFFKEYAGRWGGARK